MRESDNGYFVKAYDAQRRASLKQRMKTRRRSNKRWMLVIAILLLMTFTTATVFAFWQAGLWRPDSRQPEFDFGVGAGRRVETQIVLGPNENVYEADADRDAIIDVRNNDPHFNDTTNDADRINLVPHQLEDDDVLDLQTRALESTFTVAWVPVDDTLDSLTAFEGRNAVLEIEVVSLNLYAREGQTPEDNRPVINALEEPGRIWDEEECDQDSWTHAGATWITENITLFDVEIDIAGAGTNDDLIYFNADEPTNVTIDITMNFPLDEEQYNRISDRTAILTLSIYIPYGIQSGDNGGTTTPDPTDTLVLVSMLEWTGIQWAAISYNFWTATNENDFSRSMMRYRETQWLFVLVDTIENFSFQIRFTQSPNPERTTNAVTVENDIAFRINFNAEITNIELVVSNDGVVPPEMTTPPTRAAVEAFLAESA